MENPAHPQAGRAIRLLVLGKLAKLWPVISAGEAGIVEPAEGIEPSLSTTVSALEERTDTRAILLSELDSLNACSKRFTAQGEGKPSFLVKIPRVHLRMISD